MVSDCRTREHFIPLRHHMRSFGRRNMQYRGEGCYSWARHFASVLSGRRSKRCDRRDESANHHREDHRGDSAVPYTMQRNQH